MKHGTERGTTLDNLVVQQSTIKINLKIQATLY